MVDVASAFFDGIWKAALLVGVLFLTGYVMLWRWRSFSDRLGRSDLKKPQHELELYTVKISNQAQYTSLTTESHRYWKPVFGLHPDGLSVRLGLPYGILAKPVFLPFDGMRIENTNWPLTGGDDVAISHKSAPGVFMIADAELAEWAAAREPRFPSPVTPHVV